MLKIYNYYSTQQSPLAAVLPVQGRLNLLEVRWFWGMTENEVDVMSIFSLLAVDCLHCLGFEDLLWIANE